MPKVSICIPAYKQTELLGKCIDSILIQDYTDYEIVITDDTPDNSVLEFLKSKKLNDQLRYYKNPVSLGSPENWNCAVGKASGEYIKLLHHDDFFTHKDSLSKLVKALDDNPASSFAFCATMVWNLRDNKKRIHRCSPKQLQRIKREPEFLFFRNMIGAPSVTIYRNEFNFRYDKRLTWFPDIDFYIRALKQKPGIVMCNEALVCTADGAPGQVTQSVVHNKQIQIKEHLLVFEKLIHTVANKNKYTLFFDELFTRFEIKNISDIRQVCEVPPVLIDFFTVVFAQQNKKRLYKKFRNWFYGSRFNNQLFRLEKY